ncbi:MAG: glycosyltransferase family 39 protein [Candidatus Eisenbacteria bacterium]
MIPFLSVIVALLLLVASGEGLLLLLRIRSLEGQTLDRLIAAFTAGTAVIATWSFLLAGAGVPASPPLLAAPVALYIAGRLRNRGGEGPYLVLPRRPVRDFLGAVTGIVVLAQIVYVFRHALIRPVHGWDAWRIWSFRAKVIFLEKGFPDEFFSHDWAGFPGYPLGIPLLESYLAHFVGYWHEPAVKILFPLFFTGLAALVWRFLREHSGFTVARLGVLLFVTSPFAVHHGTVAYMDLPLAFFLMATAFFLMAYHRGGRRGDLLLAAIAAGMMPIVKNEGFPFYLICTVWVVLDSRRRRDLRPALVRWFAISLPVCLPWLLFKYTGGVPESPYHVVGFFGVGEILRRLSSFLRLALINAFLTGSWGIAWYPLVLLPLRLGRPVPRLPLALLLGGGFLFAGAYLFTDSYTFLVNGTALSRNLLVLLPLAIVSGMMRLGDERRAP